MKCMKKKKKKMKKTIYQKYETGIFWEIIQRLEKVLKIEQGYLKALLIKSYPQLKDNTCCPNCNASMAVYWHHIDSLTASLLLQIGDVVRGKLKKGYTLHEANKVHVQSDLKASYAVKSRTTIASKHGLITKVMKDDGKGGKTHDKKAGWLITKRGFNFLRGEKVPRSVKVFRNNVVGRADEMITIVDALNDGKGASNYNYSDWVDIDSFAQGQMF